MGNQQSVLCGSNIGPPDQENQAKIQALIRQNRKQFHGDLCIPSTIRQKITTTLRCKSFSQVTTGRKIWQVTKPRHFFYINQLGKEEDVPCGLCTIFLYNQTNDFAAFFKGNVNSYGIRESKNAVYVFSNGDSFVGDPNKSDFGIYRDHSGHYLYEGQWMNGKPHGIGKQTSDSGVYEGYFLNGKKQGLGKYVFHNGYIYDGQFQNNFIHGKGCLKYTKDKYQYTGDFKLAEKCGIGVQITQDYKYQGGFNKDKKMGPGKIIYFNQNIEYVGCFNNGNASGLGKINQNGKIISGYWQGGQLKTLFDSG